MKESNSTKMVGNLKALTRLIVSIIPPQGGLVRSGGDCAVTASGAVQFDPPLSPTELIVGTYTPMSVAQTRLSLKLLPGRGLVDPRDPTVLVFQRAH
jgi:hypothetical protein